MVSMLSALLHAINTIKNTIDDADYSIDWSYFNIIFQYFANSSYSRSIVNEPFLQFNINGLVVGSCGNAMKNTILRNSC